MEMSRSMLTFCSVVWRRSWIYCFSASCILMKLSLSCLMSVRCFTFGSSTLKLPCEMASVASAISLRGCRYHLMMTSMQSARRTKSEIIII